MGGELENKKRLNEAQRGWGTGIGGGINKAYMEKAQNLNQER